MTEVDYYGDPGFRRLLRNTILVLICAALMARGQDWKSWGGDPGGSRFSSLAQINRSNVSRLRVAWTYHTGEKTPKGTDTGEGKGRVDSFETTPLVAGGIMYLSTQSSRVIALDPETGHQIWQFDPQADRGVTRSSHVHRGVAYWQSADGNERRILFGTLEGAVASRLIALDARTGKLCRDFGKEGAVDLRAGVANDWPGAIYAVTSPPAIYKDLVIVGAEVPEYPSKGPSGEVRAFDVRTGRLVWTFHTIPRPGERGSATWQGDAWKNRTGANVWSIMSVDVKRGMVFLPVGSPSYDFYGADRKGENLYGNSLVALDAATGKYLWHYQMVHHDLWDYDLPAQPSLITVRRNGREIPAVAQVTKMGLLFLLDRVTGKPLFTVVERPVPASRVPGESAYPTQPFPVRPPPLVRQSMSAAEITTMTPKSNSYCTALFHSLENRGMYSPYGQNMTLVAPGNLGGGTWSGGSFETSTGRYFVNVNELYAIGALQAQPAGSPEAFRRSSKWGEYAWFWDENQWPCQKPPWGTLNAIDVNTGKIAWKVPLGSINGLNVNTGSPNLGGSIVTAGGLLFIGATVDSRFRAFDTSTGKELWTADLEAAAYASPMTYTGRKTGKQFVAIAAGGGGIFRGKISDALVVFALRD